MQVLGVQHDQQEHQHHADMQQQGDGLDDLVGVGSQGMQEGGDAVGKEGRRAVGQVAVVDRRTAEERVGPDDIEDHEENQPGAAGVGAVEAGRPAVLLGFGAKPDDREGDDAEKDGDGEEVLEEAKDAPRADDRNVELRIEQHPVGLEVDRGQNEKAPHREEVRDAGNRPAQESGLAEDLAHLVADPLAEVVLASAFIRCRLARTDQLFQPQHSLCGECNHDGGHGQADDQPDENLRIHGVPLQVWQLPVGNSAVVTGQ